MNLKVNFLINQALQSISLGRLTTAELYLKQALTLQPKNTHTLRFMGVVLAQNGQWEDAVNFFKESITSDPKNAFAYSNLGNALLELEKFDEAIKNYDQAIKLDPVYAEAWSNKGNALSELKIFDEAIKNYDQAIKLDPVYAEAWSNKGNALTKLKHFNDALQCYEQALALNHLYAEAWCNRGACLAAMQHYDLALTNINETLKIKSNYKEAWLNLGQIFGDLGQHGRSLENYQKAYAIDPNIDFLDGLILNLKGIIGDWSSYKLGVDNILAKLNLDKKVTPPLGLLAFTDSPDIHLKAAKIWVDTKYPINTSLGKIPKIPSHQKIKIAYFSADFKEHPVSYLTAELFELHNRGRFEVYAFSLRKAEQSPIRERLLATFDHFIEVDAKSDQEVALLARELEIDIAIDLGGHTQHARTGIFAHRAAPIQINYLGFAGTMGASFMDYIVVDKVVIPDEYKEYYLEKKVYLPNSYMVDDSRRLPSNKVFKRADFGLPEEGLVFCCFNNSYKFNPARIASFATILTRVPNSVLWVTGNNESFRKNLVAEFDKLGITKERIIFSGIVDAIEDHLARYRLADLFLDTSPYNAHTTAMDSLKAGVPILTLAGKSFASRVGASLLTAVGLPELITHNEQSFVDLAVKLGENPHELQSIKEKLANNLLSAPLFNTKLFCKHLEVAYQEMYRNHLQDLPPADIYVPQSS